MGARAFRCARRDSARRRRSSARATCSTPRSRTVPTPSPPPVPATYVPEAPATYVVSAFEGGESIGVFIEGDKRRKTPWVSQDFLGLGAEPSVVAAAKEAINTYTVGSCGPRGFYGTTSAHLDLEKSLALFLRAEEAITYSDATATVVSVIPAFVKKGDVLLIDSGANWAIQQGAWLSRSKVVWWAHNDVADLEAKLAAVAEADVRRPGSAATQRRFIIVEGLYASSGALCPLPAVVALAKRYRWRIVLDDSLAFGVLGEKGRGTVEEARVAPEDVHVTVGSLATTLGSVGGFCVGSRDIVDHQRLSGAGYCFSASAPPFLSALAGAALAEIEARPARVAALDARARGLHARLTGAGLGSALRLVSDARSPVKHFVLADARAPVAPEPAAARMLSPTSQKVPAVSAADAAVRAREEATLDEIIRRCATAADGVLLARTHTLAGEPFPARPALKIALTLRHSVEDEVRLVALLKRVVDEVI